MMAGLGLAVGAVATAAVAAAPYPQSTALTDMVLDWSSYKRLAENADNFPTTAAADGTVYTSFADGGGFGPNANKQAYVSIGIAELNGSTAQSVDGRNLIGGLNPSIARCFERLTGGPDKRKFRSVNMPCASSGQHGKTYSMLAYNGFLYLFLTPGSLSQGYKEARLVRGPFGSGNYEKASWAFDKKTSPRILQPAFLQAGRNNADLDYIYAYAPRYAPVGFGLQRSSKGGELVLLRVAKSANLMDRNSWEYFSGSVGNEAWSDSIRDAQTVFSDPAGIGWAPSAIYIQELRRYILIVQVQQYANGKFGVFESETPYGPWSTVFYDVIANPSKKVPATGFFANILVNSYRGDGNFTLLFTGRDVNDSFNAVDARFVTTTRKKKNKPGK